MRNKILLITHNIIPYVKEIRCLAGSVTATILMQQLDYWFAVTSKKKGSNNSEFYKFFAPSPKNPLYNEGDSWQEELLFSRKEFDNAFKKIGIKYKSSREYKEAEDKFKGKYYCSVYYRLEKKTVYYRNNDLLDNDLDKVMNGEMDIVPKGKWSNEQKDNVDLPKGTIEVTETTTEITNRENLSNQQTNFSKKELITKADDYLKSEMFIGLYNQFKDETGLTVLQMLERVIGEYADNLVKDGKLFSDYALQRAAKSGFKNYREKAIRDKKKFTDYSANENLLKQNINKSDVNPFEEDTIDYKIVQNCFVIHKMLMDHNETDLLKRSKISDYYKPLKEAVGEDNDKHKKILSAFGELYSTSDRWKNALLNFRNFCLKWDTWLSQKRSYENNKTNYKTKNAA